jgi:CheY-like chemotaxis protein
MARVQEGELEMRTGDDGTELTLTLRALDSEALLPPPSPRGAAVGGEPAPARAVPELADFRPRRILLVDDDEYNRLVLQRYLPSPPFTVETAVNGLAATEAIARQWPDIVLIDMEMPVMDGLDTVGWIREHEAAEGRRPCLVVMMSSNDDAESIRRGLAAGSDRYLPKPFTRETLLATLHELDTGDPTVPPTASPLDLNLAEASPSNQQPPVAPDAPVRVDPQLRPEVPAFLDSRRKLVEAMAAALESGDRAELRAVAHRAAGGLALFGFQWAAWQSRRISAQAGAGELAQLREAVQRLREHLATVQVV